MFDRFALHPDLRHGLDSQFQVIFRPLSGHTVVGLLSLDSLGRQRDIRYQKECPARDPVMVAHDKDGSRFHVYGNTGHLFQPVKEGMIMFPNPPVGGVNHAGAILIPVFNDFLRDELVQFEGGEGRYLRREV